MSADALEALFSGEPPNRVVAMSRALVLAIVAPTEEKCDRACLLAADIADGLTPDQMNEARLSAEAFMQEHFAC
jgi:hypothetical protein